jgi:hypothetical protein
MLYLKNNNLVNDENVLNNDLLINKNKKSFDKNLNDVIDAMKCIVCSKIPNEFFICSLCKSIFCEDCLGKNKELRFCIKCSRIINSKMDFINIPIFNKIINYIDSIKKNNENHYNNQIQDNLDKNVILCSEEIHKKNKVKKVTNNGNNLFNTDNIFNTIKLNFKEKEKDDESCFDKKIEIKAVYFCMECSRPFCSDCILNYKINKKNSENNNLLIDKNDKIPNNIENKNATKNNDNNLNIKNNMINFGDNMNNNSIDDDENNNNDNKHNCSHHIFRIDLLKDVGIFDLLYEKNMSENLISEMDTIDTSINNKINDLNENKQNMILFLDYIKNIYVEKIEEIINKLKNVVKEKTEKINIIKQKNQELTNFLSNLKTKNDLKNNDNMKNIKQFLIDFNNFHYIPYEINKNANEIMEFKGILNLKQLRNVQLNFNINDSIKKKFIVKNDFIKIKHEKLQQMGNIDKLLDKKDINNEEDFVRIIYKKNKNNKKNKYKKNDFFYYPILINKNKKEFILLKEMEKNNNIIKSDKKLFKNDKISFGNNYDDDNEFSFNSITKSVKYTFNEKKKYFTDININQLKKKSDELCNANFDIYNLNIF